MNDLLTVFESSISRLEYPVRAANVVRLHEMLRSDEDVVSTALHELQSFAVDQATSLSNWLLSASSLESSGSQTSLLQYPRPVATLSCHASTLEDAILSRLSLVDRPMTVSPSLYDRRRMNVARRVSVETAAILDGFSFCYSHSVCEFLVDVSRRMEHVSGISCCFSSRITILCNV